MASFILDAILKDYDFPPSVHGLMMIVAGYYFYFERGKDDS